MKKIRFQSEIPCFALIFIVLEIPTKLKCELLYFYSSSMMEQEISIFFNTILEYLVGCGSLCCTSNITDPLPLPAISRTHQLTVLLYYIKRFFFFFSLDSKIYSIVGWY